MGCFTMDVVASTSFGMDINSQKDEDNEFVKKSEELTSNAAFNSLFTFIVGKGAVIHNTMALT